MIDLYTTHCPKCRALEIKLAKKNVQYKEHSDVDEMIKLGFSSTPVLIVDGVKYNFSEAIKWVNALEG